MSKNEQFSAHDLIIPVPVCDTANGRFITQMTSSTSYEWRSLLMLLKIIAESLKPLIKKIINVVFTQVFDFINKLNGYRKKMDALWSVDFFRNVI